MKKLISSIALLILTVIFMSADNRTIITGKVTNDQGAALTGVSVLVKNTSRGTLTDRNGEYHIPIFDTDKVLIFAYIGMKDRKSVV